MCYPDSLNYGELGMKEIQTQKQYQSEEDINTVNQIINSEQFGRVQKGERNDALVASLQTLLVKDFKYDLGKTGKPLENGVDGDYGDLTAQAVEDFKTKYAKGQVTAKSDGPVTAVNVDQYLVQLGNAISTTLNNDRLSIDEVDQVTEAIDNLPDVLRNESTIAQMRDEFDGIKGTLQISTRGSSSTEVHVNPSTQTNLSLSYQALVDPTNFKNRVKSNLGF